MEIIDTVLSELDNILKNFKKTPNRIYLRESLDSKQFSINNFKKLFSGNIDSIPVENREQCKTRFEKLIEEIDELLVQKFLVAREKSEKKNKVVKMSFNIENVMKIVPEFSGNVKEIEKFLTIVEYIYIGLSEENDKAQLIDFIIKVKLSAQVRTAISLTETPRDFNTLKTKLNSTYKSTKTLNEIFSSLSVLKQGRMSVKQFNDKIVDLVTELNHLQITDLNTNSAEAKNAIIESNNKFALNIFKNGISEDIKPTVYASQPKNLTDAVNLASEVEKDSEKSVMYFKRNTNFRGRGNNRYPYKQMENNDNRHYDNNNYSNRGNRGNYGNQGNNGRYNGKNRGGYYGNNRGGYRGGYNNRENRGSYSNRGNRGGYNQNNRGNFGNDNNRRINVVSNGDYSAENQEHQGNACGIPLVQN